MNNESMGVLALFEGERVGDEELSDRTPRTKETGDEEGAPAAGEQQGISREEAFRALMEGDYKDLFAAHFQQAFNRRFKEHKQIKEELDSTREVLGAVKECFGGLSGDALLEAIRAETVLKNAPTAAQKPISQPPCESTEERVRREVEEACELARHRLLESIRARGMRPLENGLSTQGGQGSESLHLTRAERAEMARRAANGERIEL